MGCYIGVARSNGEPLADLRQDKYSGAREFISILGNVVQLGDEWEMIRPKPEEFARIERDLALLPFNSDLYAQMISALKSDPDCWLSVSY